MIGDGRFRPTMIPPMSPTFWRTMDEEIFRQLIASRATLLCSRASYEAIRERCAEIGIEWPKEEVAN